MQGIPISMQCYCAWQEERAKDKIGVQQGSRITSSREQKAMWHPELLCLFIERNGVAGCARQAVRGWQGL